jgi:hypothetical protein
MRDQYAGDVSDLLKFAFLRTLAADDKIIGLGWYYNPGHDGRSDGRHREYCDEPKWKPLDAALWNALRGLPERSLHEGDAWSGEHLLDADVVAWLKANRRGYQTRINRILRVALESQPRRAAR